jgi:RHS repeat-associated protein
VRANPNCGDDAIVNSPEWSYYRARYYDPSIGRFLSEDPLRFAADEDFYTYVLDNPIDGIDPSGLNTTVIIIYDKDYGITYGSHAALLIDNGGDPILYDPAGSYSAARHCGSGQACIAPDADADKYKKYHADQGSKVLMYVFKTTPEDEKQIANRIDDIGGAAPFFCACSVSDAIEGIGPFKNLKGSCLPGRLAQQLQDLLNPPPPRKGGGKK